MEDLRHDMRLRAVILRGHLKLLAAGMYNSRFGGTQILAKASEVTGRAYKRGQYQVAVEDLNALIKESSHV